jgi:hypothetical protein
MALNLDLALGIGLVLRWSVRAHVLHESISSPYTPNVRHPSKRSSIEVVAKIHFRAHIKT